MCRNRASQKWNTLLSRIQHLWISRCDSDNIRSSCPGPSASITGLLKTIVCCDDFDMKVDLAVCVSSVPEYVLIIVLWWGVSQVRT